MSAVLAAMSYRLALAAALAIGCLPPAPALAQDDKPLVRVRAGLGAQLRPEYLGAEDNEWAPKWRLSFAFGDKPFGFSAPDQSFGISLLSKGGFSLGPAVNIERSRKNSDVGADVGKVPTTIEAGAFAQYQLSESLRLRGELRKGIGGPQGVVGSFGADKVWRDGDRYLVSIGPRLLFSNAKYQRAWFGVSPDASAATGLPVYRPGSGLHAVGAASGATFQLGDGPWGLFGFGRYERLVGDAAKSPLVREFGSRNQFAAGAGITYTFTVRR